MLYLADLVTGLSIYNLSANNFSRVKTIEFDSLIDITKSGEYILALSNNSLDNDVICEFTEMINFCSRGLEGNSGFSDGDEPQC